MEGDIHLYASAPNLGISIHALRVEGDAIRSAATVFPSTDFYPRPPGGGRLDEISVERARCDISIHALRVEGDGCIASHFFKIQ